jgi:hypothetical protein
MPGQGRKRTGSDITPVIEGEVVPAALEELDEPTGRDGEDELDIAAVEMAEDDEADEADEDEEEDEDEDEDDEGAEEDEDEDEDEDDEDEDDEAEAEDR